MIYIYFERFVVTLGFYKFLVECSLFISFVERSWRMLVRLRLLIQKKCACGLLHICLALTEQNVFVIISSTISLITVCERNDDLYNASFFLAMTEAVTESKLSLHCDIAFPVASWLCTGGGARFSLAESSEIYRNCIDLPIYWCYLYVTDKKTTFLAHAFLQNPKDLICWCV